MQGTRKVLQSKLIERKINNMLPCMDSGITNYCLFFVQRIHDEVGLESVGKVVSSALP
jgi:hypothetical protein